MHVHGAATFQMHFQKKATPAKRKQIPSLTLGPTGRLAPAPTPQNAKGGGDSPTLRGCLCGVCVCPLTPIPTLDTCVMCCGVHMPMQNCVCASRGGGGHICVCMRQVCWLLLRYILIKCCISRWVSLVWNHVIIEGVCSSGSAREGG